MINTFTRKIKSLNLFSKLILCFSIIIVLPLMFTYYISYDSIRNIMINNTYKDTINSLNIISKDVDNVFNNMVATAIHTNDELDVSNFLLSKNDKRYNLQSKDKFDKFFKNIIDINFGTKIYFTILTSNGIEYSNWEQSLWEENMYLNEYYKNNITSNYKIEWINIEKNYMDSEKAQFPYVVTLKKDLITGGGNKYGVFLESIPEKDIRHIILANEEDARRLIISEGIIISGYDDKYIGKNFKDIFKCEIPQSKKGYFINEEINSKKELITYYKLSNMNYFLVDIKSYSMVSGPVIKQRNKLLFIYFGCILIFTITAWIISKNISTPLNQLVVEMKNIDLEPYDNKIKINRKDEIGILQRSFSNMKVDIKNLVDENIEKEKRKRSCELDMLQAQISPHFLFNTLNSIRWAAINNNNEKAADMVLSLVKLLRMTVNKEGELISIKQEIDNVTNYLSILNMRHAIDISFNYSICDELEDYKIPRLLFQPIVENSIIHGAVGQKNKINITIQVSKSNSKCVIRIMDNGKGFNSTLGIHKVKTKGIKFSGIGLNNVDERIKLYFGENYGLDVNSEVDKGTAVNIYLPL